MAQELSLGTPAVFVLIKCSGVHTGRHKAGEELVGKKVLM